MALLVWTKGWWQRSPRGFLMSMVGHEEGAAAGRLNDHLWSHRWALGWSCRTWRGFKGPLQGVSQDCSRSRWPLNLAPNEYIGFCYWKYQQEKIGAKNKFKVYPSFLPRQKKNQKLHRSREWNRACQRLGGGDTGNSYAVGIKFQLCKISPRDLLYTSCL